MQQEIKSYYDQLAEAYDEDRFANSYGRFIDAQERSLLEKHLPAGNVIDLACGTGRFMNYCTTGIDISPKMINTARRKFPEKLFIESNVFEVAVDQLYAGGICFHLLMHLQAEDLDRLLKKVETLLRPGGIFIIDIKGKERGGTSTAANEWHGVNAYTHQEVKAALGSRWNILACEGIAFLPIHRFPAFIRPAMVGFDALLNKSALKKYASYRVYVLQKATK